MGRLRTCYHLPDHSSARLMIVCCKRLGTCFHLSDHGSARLMTDKVPDCVNGLAVFISRQCANK